MHLLIITGGESSEHNIALKSSQSFINTLDKNINYSVAYVSESGDWFLKENDQLYPLYISLNKKDHGYFVDKGDGYHLVKCDKAIIIMHGLMGEDGSVQGLIKLSGIPLIGCSILASAIGIDKDIAHRLANTIGIKTAKSKCFKKGENIDIANLKFPLFIKPLTGGSSIGISKAYNFNDLLKAVNLAFEYDDEVIIEENVEGREVGVAILSLDKLYMGEIDEIVSNHDFFDFKAKYQDSGSKINLPAKISLKCRNTIYEQALALFRLFKCEHFARLDFFIDQDENIYFNEINTIPGLTDHSRFPNMLKSIGISFEELVRKLVTYEK